MSQVGTGAAANEPEVDVGQRGHIHAADGQRSAWRDIGPRLRAWLWQSFAEERARFVNWLPVVFGAGIWIYFTLGSEPTVALAGLPLVTGAILTRLAQRGSVLRLVGVLLIIAGAGFVVAKARSVFVAAPVLERTLRAVSVTGVVERREPHAKRGERLTLRLISVGDVEPDRLPRRARIRTLMPAGEIVPGDAVHLTATLSPPSAPALPGGHDFARAAYFEGVGAVGFALKAPVKTADSSADRDGSLRLRAFIEDLRQDIGRRIQTALPGEQGALAAALITGERGGVSEATTDAYRDSGLVHILSISGLHMAIMAGAVFALLRLGMAAIPALALTQPIKKWAAAGGAIAAILYFAISGGSAATLRSAIMMIVFFLAIMLGRPAIAMRNVAIAALAILVVFPESLLDVGFQMSFAAVAALVAAYEAVRLHMDRRAITPGPIWAGVLFLGGILFSTLIAGFAVTPLSVYHFHAMQHYAPLANLVAVPVCNLVVMPAALATLVAMPFGLEAWPLWVMGGGIDLMGATARFVAGLPGAVTHLPQVPEAAFVCVLGGGLWLVLWQKPWRLAGIPLILAGLLLAPGSPRPDVLIGREGGLVAARDATGRLVARAERASTFELKRWLEAGGDARDPKLVRNGRAFRCDALGCVTEIAGGMLAILRHPAGAGDDCAQAHVLIALAAVPRHCVGPRELLDRDQLKASGTIALYRDGRGGFRRESVSEARGTRPWSLPPPPRRPRPVTTPGETMPRTRAVPAAGTVDVGRYAAPQAVADAFAGRVATRC
jgi:competence protein ComEC